MNGIDLNLVREYNFSYGVRNFVATTRFSTSKTKFSVQLYTAVSVLQLYTYEGKNT